MGSPGDQDLSAFRDFWRVVDNMTLGFRMSVESEVEE